MPRISTQALTEKVIESLRFDPSNRSASWCADSTMRGFMVRVLPSGLKVFACRFVTASGRRRYLTVGRWGVITLTQAREKARQILAEATLGGDPAAEKKRLRAMPAWSKWAETFLKQIAGRRKQTRQDAQYLAVCTREWKNRPLDCIGREEVEALYREVYTHGAADQPEKGPFATTANRWIQAVRPCFEEAVRSGIISTNPARGLKRYIEAPPRARVLSDDEMRRLLAVVLTYHDLHVRAGIRLLVETGARLSEVLRARWEDFDLAAGTWRIPSPKAGVPQLVPLASTTVAMLRRLPVASDYVVAGRDPKAPRHDLKGPWQEITVAAKLEDVHVHDVRRSFGLSIARSAGLHVASKLLRHGDIRVTERVYAPLGIEELRSAVEKRSKALPFAPKRKASGK